jgi:polyhydroxybutyrate depolymerase
MLLRLTCLAALLAVTACSKTETPKGSRSGAPGDPLNPTPGSSGSTTSPSGTSSGTPPGPTQHVTLTSETFAFGGEERTYELALPKTYDAKKTYPLVMSFHGNPGTADWMAQNLPFDSVSKGDAVIVYPQAATEDWDLYTPTDSNRDMAFIKALIGEVKAKKANIDTKKVFGFGYSGGAFFLTQFTCRFGGVFKAISVNAGGGPDEQQMGYDQRPNGCYICPGGAVPIIVTHGTADDNVEFASGEFTHACYASTNGCKQTLSDSTPAPCQVHDGCPASKPVKWCPIEGQSHALWDGAMTQAWAFFTSLP